MDLNISVIHEREYSLFEHYSLELKDWEHVPGIGDHISCPDKDGNELNLKVTERDWFGMSPGEPDIHITARVI